MNRNQAYQYLGQCIANIPAGLQQHQQMQAALKILNETPPVNVAPNTEAKNPAPASKPNKKKP